MKKSRKSKNSKKPNTSRPSPREIQREEDEMLSEFSDGYNDFYVDESASRERPERERPERGRGREPKPRAPKKPVTPLRRKLTRIISTVAIISIVLVVGVVLSLTVLFKTQSYEVVGNTMYLESDIIDTCAIDKGENIFLAPKRPAEERIFKRFPYVEKVNVGFSIPDTIRIDITEAAEGYLFKASDTEYLIISTKGRILNRVADKNGHDLPIFIGPKLKSGDIGDFVQYEDKTVMEIIESITGTFAENGYQGITEIDATNPAGVTFTYQGRIKVKLGIPEDLSYKIRTAMTIITEKLDINQNSSLQGVLDVSRCNQTKRSYFDEQQIVPTEAPTEAPTDTTGESGESGASGTSLGTSGGENTGGRVGFDTDGDGVIDCYDTDGDGYADTYLWSDGNTTYEWSENDSSYDWSGGDYYDSSDGGYSYDQSGQ